MLFKSTSELQDFVEINSHVNFASLKASIRSAEKEILIPIIGITWYLDLDTKFNNSTLSNTELALVKVMQAAIAPYSMALYVPKAEVSITDGGIRRAETENSKTAYQYQVIRLQKSFIADGEKAIEFLIAFLEEKKSDYPTWSATAEFKKYRSLFIKTGGQFNDFVRTASPWRNYWMMRPIMEDVEETIIKKILGEDFYAALKTKEESASPSYSDDEKELLRRLKKCIAYFTLSNAASQMALRIDESGITVTSASVFATEDDLAKRGAAPDNNLSHFINDARFQAGEWLKLTSEHLNEKASSSVFVEYYDWKNSQSSTNNLLQTESLNGLFGLF